MPDEAVTLATVAIALGFYMLLGDKRGKSVYCYLLVV